MSTPSPQPDSSSAAPDGAPKKPRNVWIWVSAGLALVAVGLLVWGLSSRSDLTSAQADLKTAEEQVDSAGQELASTQQELGAAQAELDSATPEPTAEAQPPASEEDQGNDDTAALVAAGALFTGLARELGATREEAEATEQELADAQKTADAAEQDAEAAKQEAEDAGDDAAKAKAQTDQANAERDAAQAKASIAANCAKSYISAFAGLFGSGDVREQAPIVRKELSGITDDCKAAFAGT